MPKMISGREFGAERINADGREFIDCSFNETTLVFRGAAQFTIFGGGGTSTIEFSGCAKTTLDQLALLYRSGMAGFVEAMFDRIRNPLNDPLH